MADKLSKFDPDKKFDYHVYSDRVFDEKGSTFLAMRRVAWGVSQEQEADPEKIRLELRKWNNRDGKEMANKGFSFLTEEGPHELTKALLEEGFGDTKEVIDIIRQREDFEESVNSLYDDKSDASGEYFDPRSVLFAEEA
jgi:hypothetical protein